MKLKSCVLMCSLALASSAYAGNVHFHPKANEATPQAPKGLQMPGYCQIEVINDSYSDVRVYGMFDDQSSMEPFNIRSYDSPHYINLYYYGSCHPGMNVNITTMYGYPLYNSFTSVHKTVRVIPYIMNKAKVVISN